MTTVARFTIPAESFPMGSVFERFPGATIELERIVPTNGALVPYVWVRGAETDEIEAAFEGHPALEGVTPIDSIDGEHLLRIEWSPDYESILSLIVDTDVSLLSAIGTSETWAFEVRSRDTAALSALQRALADHDIPVELTSLHGLTSPADRGPSDLTDTQREALLLAHERGYYETPRGATLEDLASELGISRQALSSRLRRGTDHLIADSIGHDG